MAIDNIYPCCFAYPYGADAPAITKLLVPDKFQIVRGTGSAGALVDCQKMKDTMGDGLFVGAFNMDKPAGMSMDMYNILLNRAAAKEDQTLIFYGHGIYNRSDNLFVGDERLRDMIIRAQALGFQFRRMCDVCM